MLKKLLNWMRGKQPPSAAAVAGAARCSAKTYPHNPNHPIGTCTKCGGDMVYNVPRMGTAGGFVHKATGRLVCGSGRCDACGGDHDNADCPELAKIMRRYSPNNVLDDSCKE